MRALAAGVDTWAPTWIVDPDSPDGRHLSTIASRPSALGSRIVPWPVAGHRVLWWEGWGLLKAEGHPSPGALCPPRELAGRLAALQADLYEADVPVPIACRRFKYLGRESAGFAGFSRLDLTVDLSFPDGSGQHVLKAVRAAASWSGFHSPTYGRRSRVETVYVQGERGVLSRWYDKGVEALSAPAGHLIRPEAQLRFSDKRRRPDDQDLGDPQEAAAWMRERFARRFDPWCRGRIVVGDMSELGSELRRAVRAGRLTRRQAESIGGYLLMRSGGDVPGLPVRTRQYRERQIREFGFVLADGVLEPVELDLDAVLTEASRPTLWGDDFGDG